MYFKIITKVYFQKRSINGSIMTEILQLMLDKTLLISSSVHWIEKEAYILV